MKSQAQEILDIQDFVLSIETAQRLSTGEDQQWRDETTVFEFSDGSNVWFSGSMRGINTDKVAHSDQAPGYDDENIRTCPRCHGDGIILETQR